MMHIASFSWPKLPSGAGEDRVFADAHGDRAVLAVADGIGGRPDGEVAAELAISEVRRLWQAGEDFNVDLFDRIVDEIQRVSGGDVEGGMGTTLSICVIHQFAVNTLHVGDCLIAHLRGSGIVRLTTPQTEAQKLLEEGILSPAAAQKYPRRNVLTSALTARRQFEPQINFSALQPKDRLCVVSDGVYGVLSLREISALSVAEPHVSRFAALLAQAVRMKTPIDDYSGALAEI